LRDTLDAYLASYHTQLRIRNSTAAASSRTQRIGKGKETKPASARFQDCGAILIWH